MSSSTGAEVLTQGTGYGVVLGIGFVFAIIMMGFNTASRSVKPGLIASGIVSAWTWAATLLQSSTVTYEYGLCAGYYYAAGATIQIFFMAILAVRVKQIAPYCHTFLEIVHARYGNTAHFMFATFGLVVNLIVSSMLLLGGSAVVNAFTGMNIYAANFLIPLGVCVYVILGGLRATFLCDYSHTLILMILIFYFFFWTYTKAELIGGFEGMYNLLQQASIDRPVAGNQDGSYLTLKSNYGLTFMIIQISGGFGTVMLDQARYLGYWQRAIASEAKTAVQAYLMGGIAWFAVPLTFSSIMGLAAVALANKPSFPYPGGLTAAEINAGLAAPAGVVTLLGSGGAAAMLILLFMAVTSAASSEMIATSSILTFDLYQIHFKPDASPESLIRVSHIMVAVWALVMSCVASLWIGIGVSLNWLFLFSGTLFTGAVGPVIFTVVWRQQTKEAAISGALGGVVVGIIAWLAVAKTYYGELTIATTGLMYPNLAGNLGACCSGAIISAVVTLVKPDNEFDWSATKRINPQARKMDRKQATLPDSASGSDSVEKEKPGVTVDVLALAKDDIMIDVPAEEYAELQKSLKIATWASLTLIFIVLFLIPIPMFLSHYVFSLNFFRGWVIICVMWLFVAASITSILPLWESRAAIKDIFLGIVRDIFGSEARKGVIASSNTDA
ncbi:Sodium:solute symporter family-domain-containing protein [Suillus spraguei]|nr:Sodium:solute symporter family-domain-containing protein [Suillus spraguei]